MPALITAVIPTFQRPKLLQRALRSILAQTFQDFVVCVYDNASDDQTADVVAGFASGDDRVRYYRHPINIGAVANFNYGVSHVDTPYFSMLSDDDVLMPELYAKAMEAFANDPDAGCFCAETMIYDIRGKSILKRGHWKPGRYEPSMEIIARMFSVHMVNTGVVFKTEVRDTIGLLNEFGSDIVYMAKAANYFPLIVSDYTGAVLTVHGASYSSGQFRSAVETQEFIISCLITLLALNGRSVYERMRLFDTTYEYANQMMVWTWRRALANGDLTNFRAALDQLRFVRLPWKARIATSCADWISRLGAPATSILGRASGWLLEVRGKSVHTEPSGAARRVIDYMQSLEEPGQ